LAFRPTQPTVARKARLLLVCAVACPPFLVGAAWFALPGWADPATFLTGIAAFGLLLSGAIVAGAVQARSAGTVPLLAEPSGRVTYGERVLLEGGAARRVYVERQHDTDHGDWFRVVASNRWGPLVLFEVPYFERFDSRETATWFARQLGEAIGAEVEEG